ncbi:MAG: alpha/beta fold hydrolase [Alistipes indistinctus]
MEKFVMAAGTALRISDTLKGGTTVVLLHGYLESLEIWGDFMKELAMHYRVLAIDIPGMGISQVRGEVHTMEFLADVLKGVLDKQGVERCFVVGHSMGGYVAEAFAAKYASMLQGLVLFHSTPNPDTEEKRRTAAGRSELVRADKKELIAELFCSERICTGKPPTAPCSDRATVELISMSDSDGVSGRPERIDPAGRSERNAAKSERAATLHLRSGKTSLFPWRPLRRLSPHSPKPKSHGSTIRAIWDLSRPEQALAILTGFIDRYR